MADNQKQPLFRILAIGDSLTAGYYNYGRAYHPYATHLTHLFGTVNIPVQIDERGVSGGTNDLADEVSAEKIFNEGLKPMYEMCLNHTQTKTKLAAMTVIENSYDLPTHDDDKDRQTLNTMIRDYVAKSNEQDRICLVDLDRGIPYHTASNDKERKQIWDDGVHLTPAGYDRMATLAFEAIKNKL